MFDAGRVIEKSFDSKAQTWTVKCKDPCVHGEKGSIIWYDDAHSLAPKYQLARHNKLLGVGMWKVDNLPVPEPDGDPHATDRKAMWEAISNWHVKSYRVL